MPAATPPVRDRLLLAIGIRLFAAFALATMNALAKLAEGRGASVAEVLFFRQALSLPVVLALVVSGPGLASIATRRLRAHVVRMVSGLAGMVCLFVAVARLPLADATTLGFTTPIFATILGATLLREPTGWHRWAAVVVGFAGVVIVAEPGGGRIDWLGMGAGLGWGVVTALVSIQLRQIGKTERPTTTVFWFAALSMPILVPVFALTVRPHDAMCWLLLVAVGVSGGATQVALTGALKYGPVSVVVPMDYSGLFWSAVYGFALFGALPAATLWVGAPIIVGSGLYIVWRESRRRAVPTERAIADD